jgi:hypothetical protein
VGRLIAMQRLLHHLRDAMRQAIGDTRYGVVLIALAIGDPAGIALVAAIEFLRFIKGFGLSPDLVGHLSSALRIAASDMKSCAGLS